MERENLLNQRVGDQEAYYNPQLFLEPLQAKCLHRTLISSTQRKGLKTELEIINVSTSTLPMQQPPPAKKLKLATPLIIQEPTPQQLCTLLTSSNTTLQSQNHNSMHLSPQKNVSPSPPPYSPITSPPDSPITSSNNFDTFSPQFNTNFETPALGHIIAHDYLPPLLHEILPPAYTYIFQKISFNPSNLACCTTFLINSPSQESATKWITDFQEQNKTTYRITRGTQCKGKRIIYKTVRHCQHKRKKSKRTLKRQESIRNKKTECNSNFTLRVYNSVTTKNSIHKNHPCEVILSWDHNHSLNCAKALSFRPISQDTVEKFHLYFDQGHSPSSALHLHQLNLAIKHDEDLEYAKADRSLNPQYSDVFYLYKKWRIKNHGEQNGEVMFEKLDVMIQQYNKEFGSEGGRAFLQKFERSIDSKSEYIPGKSIDTPLVLAVCTPLMARAHTLLQQAGELVYCDSTSSLDRCSCPTFVFSTSSSGGGIPLGIVVTSGESETTIMEAFAYLRALLPSNAFFGRGSRGPLMFITDDCEAEKNALKTVWPESRQLLCIFHYLQSWWRWLWDSTHDIPNEKRRPIMNIIRSLVYITSEKDLGKSYEDLTNPDIPNSFVNQYPNLQKHLQSFWKRRSEWALSHRVWDLTRGNHTNNYAEAGIRVLKELIFGRVKAYNLIQMYQFITTTMDTYYSSRLLDIAHSRFRPGLSLRYRELNKLQNNITTITHARDGIYVVHEQVQIKGLEVMLEYLVDMELGVCSCSTGCTGAACKHQAATAKKFQLPSTTIAPVHSKDSRHLFAIIARGEHNTKGIEFYAGLQDEDSNNIYTHKGNRTSKFCKDSVEKFSDLEDTLVIDNTINESKEQENQMQSYRKSLTDIVDDLMERLLEGDHNLISGINHFIKSYNKMEKSPSPNSTISYALHNFGKSDSKLVS